MILLFGRKNIFRLIWSLILLLLEKNEFALYTHPSRSLCENDSVDLIQTAPKKCGISFCFIFQFSEHIMKVFILFIFLFFLLLFLCIFYPILSVSQSRKCCCRKFRATQDPYGKIFCLIYQLKSNRFQDILKKFPRPLKIPHI